MRFRAFILLAVFVAASGPILLASEEKPVVPGLKQNQPVNFAKPRAFKLPEPIEAARKELEVGEELEFDVIWMGLPVGAGLLKVLEKTVVGGRECYHVVAIARTNEVLSVLFPVADEVHSFIDCRQWRSVEFRKKLKEGHYRADERVVYDYDQKKGLFKSLLNHGEKEFEVPGSAQDFLSAFYWFRTQDIEPGKSVHTVINDEGKTWDLEIAVLKQELKEMRGQPAVNSVLVEPKTSYKGVLYNRGRAQLYFSADSRRVPFWIKISTPFGPVLGVLRSDPGSGSTSH